MDANYLIQKLREQIRKVNQTEALVWLNTTYSLIEEYFKSYSPRATSFRALIHDYETKKIFGLKQADVNAIKIQGLQYIDEIILYLEEQIENQRKAEFKQAEIQRQQKTLQPTVITKTETKLVQTPPPPPIIKYKLPFGMPVGLFWTIFAGIVTAGFLLGVYFGSSKFDREKSDYYEQLKSLKLDTTNLNKTIILKDSTILQKDSLLKVKEDSLFQQNKTLNALYQLVNEKQK